MTKSQDPDGGEFRSLEEAKRCLGEKPWEGLFGHEPVLLREAVAALDINLSGFYVDATLGGGGFSRAILSRLGLNGRLLALDIDPEPLKWAGEWGKGDGRLILQKGNFADLRKILKSLGLGEADGIVADLGLSSRQFLEGERGFSFKNDGPLDMRLDPENPLTAAKLVNTLDEQALAALIRENSGDFHARRIARLIVARREKEPILTTAALSAIALRAYSPKGAWMRIHPASRLFLALRIAVNSEKENLASFLSQARDCLKIGGRLLVISFQSGEDRLVKNLFRSSDSGFKSIWKKCLTPSNEELKRNARARSAKLRGGIAL